MAKDLGDVRDEIARLALRKDLRIVPRSKEMPCVWHPMTVNNPETGIPFTDISAWHHIAHLASSGTAITEILMEKPPGEVGYEMISPLEANMPDLYVKVQLKRGKIWGRSFHYSDRARLDL